MLPDLFWIPGPWRGRLAISTRPRGGDWLADEIQGWRSAGIRRVVSLLDKEEETQLGLVEEGHLAEDAGIRFVSFPIPDRGVPDSMEAVASLLRDLTLSLDQGENVAVHCRQGVGRSALISAGALVAAGMDPSLALDVVGKARGVSVPETPEQRRWIQRLLVDHLVTTHH